MLKVKFNNKQKLEDVTFSQISNNVVQLIGSTRNQSGFVIKNEKNKIIGDYSDYEACQ